MIRHNIGHPNLHRRNLVDRDKIVRALEKVLGVFYALQFFHYVLARQLCYRLFLVRSLNYFMNQTKIWQLIHPFCASNCSCSNKNLKYKSVAADIIRDTSIFSSIKQKYELQFTCFVCVHAQPKNNSVFICCTIIVKP